MPPTPIYLFDTSVLVDYFKGYKSPAYNWTVRALKNDLSGFISTITDYELWIFIQDEPTARRYKIALARFARFRFNTTIARRAANLWRPFKDRSEGPKLVMDALIAATAENYGAAILTKNVKDFNLLRPNAEIINCN